MAHFLPTEILPAAPHVLAALQPRGTHRATGRGGQAHCQPVCLGCLHFHAPLTSVGVMLRDATAGGCDTHRHPPAHRQTESDVQANRPISL